MRSSTAEGASPTARAMSAWVSLALALELLQNLEIDGIEGSVGHNRIIGAAWALYQANILLDAPNSE